jgi:hypothetical protein
MINARGSIPTVVAALAVVMALASPSTLASPPFKPLAPIAVKTPRGVGVEAGTGNLFVVDGGDNEVEELSGEGVAIGAFGGAAPDLGEFLEGGIWGVAVDNSGSACKGDVYVTAGGKRVDRFSSSGGPGEYVYDESVKIEAGSNVRSVAVDSEGNAYSALWSFLFTGVDEVACGGTTPTLIDENEEKLSLSSGIAVDPSGDVYVVNENKNVVKFNALHERVSEPELENEAESATAVAVDPETSEVFVVDSSPEYHVTRYSATGAKLEAFGAGEIEKSVGIVYSPASKEVYVTDETKGEVHVYIKTSGGGGKAPEVECKESVKASTATSVTLGCDINPEGESTKWQFKYREEKSSEFRTAPEVPGSIDVSGEVKETIAGLMPQKKYIYLLVATNKHQTKSHEELFETPPAVEGITACVANAVTAGSAMLTASVEPKGSKVEGRFEYGTDLSYGLKTKVQESANAGTVAMEELVTGLEPNKPYDCRLTAGREIEGHPYTTDGANGTFKTEAVQPDIVSQSSSHVSSHSVQLDATIDPENSATTYHIEYVPAAEYCEPCADPYEHGGKQTPVGEVGSDISYHNEQQIIEGLAPNETYDYRVVATNSPGEQGTGTTDGPNQTFATNGVNPPTATTGPVSDLTPTGATLSGTVNPEGYATSYAFEVGTSTEYGTVISGQLEGSGTEAQNVALALADLSPATTYYYRLSATNANGTSLPEPGGVFETPGNTYSLTLPLTAPLLAVPQIVFPTGSQKNTGLPGTRKLTRAQKLRNALRICAKKSRGKRAGCARRARSKYGPARKRRKG